MTETNGITGLILDASIRIHKKLGPGLLESVYEEILSYELERNSLYVERQKGILVVYDRIVFENGFRADLVIENKVIVEIKSVEALNPVHCKQLYTYLKLTGIKDGILVNFNSYLLKDGFHRLFNNEVD